MKITILVLKQREGRTLTLIATLEGKEKRGKVCGAEVLRGEGRGEKEKQQWGAGKKVRGLKYKLNE